MKQAVCCLTLPNNLEYIPVVLDFVRSLARIAGLKSNESTELEIATEEAVRLNYIRKHDPMEVIL